MPGTARPLCGEKSSFVDLTGLAKIRWRQLDITNLAEGAPVEHPDLQRVDEIGWTTLMTGGNTPASSRVDWIAVYGRAVPRKP